MSNKSVLIGALSTVVIACSITYYRDEIFAFCNKIMPKPTNKKRRTGFKPTSYDSLIGNTPLVKLSKLSHRLGCNIFAKMESMNPSGSGKDRAVQAMLDGFEDAGLLSRHSRQHVIEGSSGSTGIALAFQCRARGYQLHIVMPDDQAEEKRRILETLGAIVHITRSCSIANPDHYVNRARLLAQQLNGVFVNQFENTANYYVHYESTAVEIIEKLKNFTSFPIDAFVMSSGTGGTIAGISQKLKERFPNCKVILADPMGSSLFYKVKHNVCYTAQQAERGVRKHRYDSIVEGVGLDRITANFEQALIDDAYQIPDQELLEVAHLLLQEEGIFIGSSSALNIAATIKACSSLPRGSTVVTIICDSGQRHLSRFWSSEYVGKYGLTWPSLPS